ncbi:MAG: hypothetical protein PUC47_02935, partial [Oscillospiraceae bacterium]|nr:hypothetical protein [Oscillospiraceae bacterium]
RWKKCAGKKNVRILRPVVRSRGAFGRKAAQMRKSRAQNALYLPASAKYVLLSASGMPSAGSQAAREEWTQALTHFPGKGDWHNSVHGRGWPRLIYNIAFVQSPQDTVTLLDSKKLQESALSELHR